MLPHQKTKPFACMEQGCSKSYCDDRSLRRQYEVEHGLYVLKEAPPEEEACGDSSPAHDVAGQPAADGLRSLVPPEARSPGSLLPNQDLLPSTVSSMVHQEISSPGPVLAGPSDDGEGKNTACPCPPSLGPYPCTPASPGILGTDVPEECHSLWKEPAAEFTATHSRVAEDGGPDPAESERPPQRLPTLESGQEGGTLPAGLHLIQGQAAPASAEPSNHNFQWLQNLPGCPESEGDDVFAIQKPTSVSPQEGSESGPRPSSTSLTGEPSPSGGPSLEDALPLPPALLKAPGEASGDPGYASEEGDTGASKESDSDSDSCSQQHVERPALQEALTLSWLSSDATPLFRQLFLKSQECLVSQEQMQVLQMIAKSQRIISGPQVAVASSQHAVPEGKQAALKPLQGPQPHPPPPLAPTVDSFYPGPGNPEAEGSPPHKGKTMPAYPREALPGSNRRDTKGGPKVAPAPWQTPGNPDVSSLATQLRSTKGSLDLGDILPTGGPRQTQLGGDDPAGAQLPGKQAQAESGLASGAMKGAKGLACSWRRGHRLIPGNSQDKRFSDFQKEKLKMDMCCEASPSKVAMASFSSAGPLVNRPQDSKSKLMISNRIQGGNTYRLPDPVKEESMAGGCNQQNGGPADWAEPRSTYVCKNCSQMFQTEEGLTSHMCFPNDQWLSPRGNQDQQVALETLSLSGPQKPPTHLLADYHYAGSAIWTPVEKELFHKGFCVYKRNFSLIQKMVRTKTVAQCVQYYYGWKKSVRFTTSSWAPGLDKRVKRKLAEADPTETKATCSPQKRRHHHPTLELKTETESGRGESIITASPSAAPKRTPEPPGRVQGQGAFPCGECERVFDKMWTRCAHMKRHRLQDPEETAVGEERPAKAFKVGEEEEEEEGEMGADMGPLQG